MKTNIKLAELNHQMTCEAFEIIDNLHKEQIEEVFYTLMKDSFPSLRVKEVTIYAAWDENKKAYEPQFNVECCFYNEEENKNDFHSTFWIRYSPSSGIEFNQSTSGYFGSDDWYQCQRVLALAYFIQNYSIITTKLNTLSELCKDWLIAYNERENAKTILQDLNIQMRSEFISETRKAFNIGMKLKIADGLPPSRHMFPRMISAATIVKINPKNIIMKTENEMEFKIPAEALALYIYEGNIIIDEESHE